MNGKQRAFLKKLSHGMKPVIQVGKDGVTPNLIDQISETIKKRELIKISVLESCPEEVDEVMEKVLSRAKCQYVQMIGRKITIYKKNEQNPVIELPRIKK